MITVVKASLEHIQGIIRVCSDGYRSTYLFNEYIERRPRQKEIIH
ncbi:hypothetical protein [Metabacillus flavus]|nr:hypothetical protein [Metabacillus flavus]